MITGGNLNNSTSAGSFFFKSQDIGCRATKPSLSYNQISLIEVLFEMIIAIVLFFIVLPVATIYLIYRLGFKKTIKFFKRIDREYKTK